MEDATIPIVEDDGELKNLLQKRLLDTVIYLTPLKTMKNFCMKWMKNVTILSYSI